MDIQSVSKKIVEWAREPVTYLEQTSNFYNEILNKYDQKRMFEDLKKIILDEFRKN